MSRGNRYQKSEIHIFKESASVCDSIASWLDGQPDNTREYTSVTKPTTARGAKRMQQPQEHVSSKRCKLATMSHNTMPLVDREGEKSQKLKTPQTTRVTRRTQRSKALTEPPTTPTSSAPPLQPYHDAGATPRARESATVAPQDSIWPLPSLAPRPCSPLRAGSQASSSSRNSARSRSPTKKVGDFQLSDIKVELVAFGTPGYSVPASAKDLYNDMRDIGQGIGVIPVAVKEQAMKDMEDKEDRLHEWNFTSASPIEQSANIEGSLGQHAIWDRLVEIRNAALYAQNRKLAEPSWNSEVHSRLLNLAFRGHWQSRDIWYCDITTARIHDATLLPTRARGAVMQSKMIDYVLMLDRPPALYDEIIDTLREEDRDSINQVKAEGVRYSPIAVSIEVKRASIEEDNAQVQLATWVTAHFGRLRQLCDSQTVMPVLPLILVQGHEWKMMLAEAIKDRGITILQGLHLGNTDKMLGIYEVQASLARLVRWID